MTTVFILRIEEETLVFSSADKTRTHLINHSDDYLLEPGDIDRLLEGGALWNGDADFYFGEYEVL